ncbi:DUF1453 domain-containing protein [Streptomyces gelaticus]|uniref:DUF1453 domain-containing protein n=1 Tax=Streptomyces gelaticus TaxID=285446 RepID=A0ABQ2W4K8_9ACTN|nr:DUF1453 domain-containing protein [Streptomyces gelaticus]GGV92191.1 DUF1453 domain-containing protein [Streptomyces gelaticus]
MSGLVDVLVTGAVSTAVIVRQCSARQISDDRRWWVLPGVLLVLSVREPGPVDPRHAALSMAVLGAEPAVGFVTGAGWGWTTRLWREADGSLWSKGTRATVFVWAGGLVLRAALYGAAALMGIGQSGAALLSALAVTLAARDGVLTWRAGRMDPAYGGSAGGMMSLPVWKERV